MSLLWPRHDRVRGGTHVMLAAGWDADTLRIPGGKNRAQPVKLANQMLPGW